MSPICEEILIVQSIIEHGMIDEHRNFTPLCRLTATKRQKILPHAPQELSSLAGSWRSFMVAAEKRTYLVNGEKLTEEQIPQIFDLGNLYTDYRQAVESYGLDETNRRFSTLLRKQLRAFVQEGVTQPLTDINLYHLIKKDSDHIQVIDPDYPQKPDLIDRANPFGWYNINETDGKETLYDASPFAKVFLDRFILEYEQIKKLIHDHLAKDPILSLTFLRQLSQTTQPIQVDLATGKTIEGFVSNWYAMAMPATQVHRGGGSYLNLYRIVAVPTKKEEFEYFVQKQGLYHKLNLKKQVNDLLNLDQGLKTFPKTEHDIMMKIIQLNPKRNKQSSEQVFLDIGNKMHMWFLKKNIKKARERQQKQVISIENSIQAILSIFETELKNPLSPQLLLRLKAFFEAIGNPLFFAKPVPQEAIVEKYHDTLALGKGRDAFIGSLTGVIPSIVKQAWGWPLCGAFSAGGLAGKAMNPHGFGGLNIPDGCMVCPHCHQLSTNPFVCSHCSFTRKGFSPQNRHSSGGKTSVDKNSRSSHKKKPPTQKPIYSLYGFRYAHTNEFFT